MLIADILVIYLAYGVPFAVYEVASSGRSIGLADAVRFVFWPVVLANWIRGFFEGSPTLPRSDVEDGLPEIRRSLESMVFGDRSVVEVLEFRDLFDRYVALSLMSARAAKGLDSAASAAAGRIRSRAAAACLSRRDRLRIEFHRVRAGSNMRCFVGRIPTTHPKYGAVVTKCVKLALLVNDPELALEFSALQPDARGRGGFEAVTVPKAVS